MLRKWFVLLPALGLLLIPAVSQAAMEQDYGFNTGNWELTLSGRATNDQDFRGVDGSADIGVGYFLNNNLELGVRESFGYNDHSSSGAGKVWTFDTRGFADFHFDMGQWQPFVGASAGWLCGDQPNTGIYGAEAGVKYFLTTSAFVFVRAGYDRFCNASAFGVEGQWVYGLGIGVKL